jgi:fructosamine-3-kinase
VIPGARDARRVSGGDINDAWFVRLEDGTPAFVKTRADVPATEYATEAAGLRWLGEAGALRVPQVLAVEPTYLALEWIESGTLDTAGEEELGHGLATLHRAGADTFGAPWPLHLGAIVLPNAVTASGGEAAPTAAAAHLGEAAPATRSAAGAEGGHSAAAEDWAVFYAELRLRPLLALARDREALSPSGVRAVEAVCDRMSALVGPPEPPARLHGDLWSGNVLAGVDGRPWLIDPAAYGGHREIDLALLRLFGRPSPRTLAAYEEAHPLADGHEERVALYQLLPLLVHAVLFGGAYGASAERAARQYV